MIPLSASTLALVISDTQVVPSPVIADTLHVTSTGQLVITGDANHLAHVLVNKCIIVDAGGQIYARGPSGIAPLDGGGATLATGKGGVGGAAGGSPGWLPSLPGDGLDRDRFNLRANGGGLGGHGMRGVPSSVVGGITVASVDGQESGRAGGQLVLECSGVVDLRGTLGAHGLFAGDNGATGVLVGNNSVSGIDASTLDGLTITLITPAVTCTFVTPVTLDDLVQQMNDQFYAELSDPISGNGAVEVQRVASGLESAIALLVRSGSITVDGTSSAAALLGFDAGHGTLTSVVPDSYGAGGGGGGTVTVVAPDLIEGAGVVYDVAGGTGGLGAGAGAPGSSGAPGAVIKCVSTITTLT